VREAAERVHSSKEAGPQPQPQPSGPDRAAAPAKRKAALHIVRVKPAKQTGPAGDAAGSKRARQDEQSADAGDDRTEDGRGGDQGDGEGLQSLLGAYGSGSESES
jgi:hypothetical protein